MTNYTVFDVSDRLRERGWLVPAYTFPANREDLSVLRIVVRAGMSLDMADLLLADLRSRTAALERSTARCPPRASRRRPSGTEAQIVWVPRSVQVPAVMGSPSVVAETPAAP